MTTLSLDANGNLASVTSPKTDEVTHLAHSSTGLLTDLVDANGNAHHFEYAPDGRLTKDVDATPGSLGQRLAVSKGALGTWTVDITSAAGRLTKHTVERDGDFGTDRAVSERRRIKTPDGVETFIEKWVDGATRTTSAAGRVTSVLETRADPRWGALASFASKVQTADGSKSMLRTETRSAPLGVAGDPFSVTSQTITTTLSGTGLSNAVTTRAFTLGPPARWTTTSPAGRQTRETLDSLDRVIEVAVLGSTPVTLEPTQLHYDSAGRIDQVTRGSRVYTTSFDPATGWPTSTTAPENLGVAYAARDANGRATSITLPGARTLGVSYDLVGNVLSVAPPSKPSHAFVMTPANRLATYAPPDLGFSPKNTDYTYDDDGLLLAMAQPGTPVAYGYDPFGRRKTVNDAVTKTFGYDTAGRLQTIVTSDGVTLTSTFDGTLRTQQAVSGPFSHAINTGYDNFFRVSTMNIDDANSVTFTRDADGIITGAAGMTANWSTNRLLTSTVAGGVTDSFTYNTYGEELGHSVTGSATSFSVTLTRDGAGRIHDKSEMIGGVTKTFRYEYDSAGRLAEVYENGAGTPTRAWTYDGNGNRSGATYDAQDRLVARGGEEFSYGANGELLKRKDTASGAETLFTYDAHGNLRHVTRPAPHAAIDYVIDGENRRVGKKVGGALVQGFLYDGARIVAELDGTGAVVSRFVYVTGGHSPDLMIKSGATYRFVKDHLGSPRLVVSVSGGALAQRVDYDEWGVVTNDTAPGFQPFGFAGGLWDRDTNLVRFGARDYDPAVGRWTTKDAIRFEGGLNLYGYVGNDPINFVDPSGYFPFSGGDPPSWPWGPKPGGPSGGGSTGGGGSTDEWGPPDPCESKKPKPKRNWCDYACDGNEGIESCNRCCEFNYPDESSKCKADCCPVPSPR